MNIALRPSLARVRGAACTPAHGAEAAVGSASARHSRTVVPGAVALGVALV